MPRNLVHCQTCRTLLNEDLKPIQVAPPEPVELKEIAAMVEVEPAGFFIECPHCQRELRVNKKYVGENVACKFCSGQFVFGNNVKRIGFYVKCPHCDEELRAAEKYMGMKVACKMCGGKLQFVAPAAKR